MLYAIKTIKVSLNLSENSTGKVNSPKTAYEIAKKLFSELDADQEHMIMFSLDSQNQIRGYKVISSGGQTNMSPDNKIIFRNALLLGAVGIILAHNHPSGEATPSSEDRVFTEKIRKASEMLDITFLDHIIMGKESYYSFAERKEIN